jgi:hypothetical protein
MPATAGPAAWLPSVAVSMIVCGATACAAGARLEPSISRTRHIQDSLAYNEHYSIAQRAKQQGRQKRDLLTYLRSLAQRIEHDKPHTRSNHGENHDAFS